LAPFTWPCRSAWLVAFHTSSLRSDAADFRTVGRKQKRGVRAEKPAVIPARELSGLSRLVNRLAPSD
jgi:hypothetical protein